ncbi:MAG: type I secretion system permease/ATPase [Alphaproteobacteria bacterium]|nr:type I secretion system permease/ATPase [Alphaproteobacteria bacterium]
MTMQQQPPKSRSEILAVLKGSRGAFISAMLFSSVVNILTLTGSIFMLQVYDRVLPSSSVPTLVALALIVLTVYAFYGLLDFVRTRIMVRIGRRVEERLRNRVFDAVAYLALRRVNVGGSLPLQDLVAIRQFLGGQGPLAFMDMPFVPLFLLVCFLLHWMLGVVALASLLIIFLLAVLTERATKTQLSLATIASNKANGITEEARRNAEALHSLGMKSMIRNNWATVQHEALDHQTYANDAGAKYGMLSKVFRMVVQSGMLAVGAYLAILHQISAGSIIASSIIMGRALAPVEQAVGSWQQFIGFRRSLDHLSKVLDLVPPTVERMKLPMPKGVLEVENLAVTLSGSERPILQGISFRVEPGQGLGIIGPTGAGKSTLARALVGILQPARGSVRLDGATSDQRDDDELGRLIGYLPQDIQIFDGTVAQNISRFSESPSSDKIVEAGKLANIHDFIMRLPQGYDTPLNEAGSRLSAGQRQRVALARALFGDPVLFVMDEPNSNLDSEGEIALDKAIRACMGRGAAVVVVAHRPSALAAMTNLLVLTNGQVAAMGSRDEIIRQVTSVQNPLAPQRIPPFVGQRPVAATNENPSGIPVLPPNKRN